MGNDPIQFGIQMMTMGTMTPPVGTVVYTVSEILDVPIEEFVKEAKPI